MEKGMMNKLVIAMVGCYALSIILFGIGTYMIFNGSEAESFSFSAIRTMTYVANIAGWALLVYILYLRYKDKLPPVEVDAKDERTPMF